MQQNHNDIPVSNTNVQCQGPWKDKKVLHLQISMRISLVNRVPNLSVITLNLLI